MIAGIDISENNGVVNWETLAEGDVQFVYAKASEAIDSVDRTFEENIKNAKKHEIAAGAYHWLHPRLHVGQQAELFIKTVGDFSGMLPPVVCLDTHHTDFDEMEKSIKVYLNIISEAVGIRPVIYTGIEYWRKYMAGASWACDFPLWLDRPGSNWPPQIWPWAGWTFWQYSYQAKLPGIATNLGLNWFNGSKTELQAMVIQ